MFKQKKLHKKDQYVYNNFYELRLRAIEKKNTNEKQTNRWTWTKQKCYYNPNSLDLKKDVALSMKEVYRK